MSKRKPPARLTASSEILSVKRRDVDLERGVLIFNHMKTGGRMLFPMGTFLRQMIEARLEDDLPFNSPWLWPSSSSGKGCTTEPKERKRGLPSPHEYRHHARTLYIAAGVPYAESALLLGQRLCDMIARARLRASRKPMRSTRSIFTRTVRT